MFLDARRIERDSKISADICIVGAGAAGITLAKEFDNSGLKVILLESGGLHRDRKTQSLYDGENVGLNYELDSTRSRFFGGSTNCWGGWCKPLSHHDYAERDWIDHSGWPISRDSMNPYYDRASYVANIKKNHFDPDEWLAEIEKPELEILKFDSDRVGTSIAQLSPTPRFGREYREDLKGSTNVDVIFRANIDYFHTDANGTEVKYVNVNCINSNQFTVHAKQFILATGGIENARLLLLSDDVMKCGLGNQNDMVGRFFMEHPKISTGEIEFYGQTNPDLYDTDYSYFNAPVIASLALSDKTQQEEGLLNYHSYIQALYEGEDSEGARDLRDLYVRLRKQDIPPETLKMMLNITKDLPSVYKFVVGKRLRAERFMRGHRLVNILEPEPNAESRVTLSNSRDPFGLQRVKMNWLLTEKVRYTLLRSQQIIDEELQKAGIGRLKIDPDLLEGGWGGEIEWVWHHMGTTRMNPDPKQGVVDTDCKLHGVKNLHVAGSSVYPTVSRDTPTLTVIALALRLADHLKSAMKTH